LATNSAQLLASTDAHVRGRLGPVQREGCHWEVQLGVQRAQLEDQHLGGLRVRIS
jgi:hypothetical protein